MRRRSKRAGIGSSAMSTSMSMSAVPDPHQEDHLAHRVGDVLGCDHGLRHARELRELVDHPLDIVDLADDGVGALLEHRTDPR